MQSIFENSYQWLEKHSAEIWEYPCYYLSTNSALRSMQCEAFFFVPKWTPYFIQVTGKIWGWFMKGLIHRLFAEKYWINSADFVRGLS